MRRFLPAAILGAALAFIPSVATAMVNGSPDYAHPEAGALYFSDTPDSPKQFACSGALIDHTAFLTAAHCFADYYRATGRLPYAWATFDQKPTETSTFYGGTIAIDPAFVPKLTSRQNVYANDTNDIAVVHLAADPGIAPASLPSANQLGAVTGDQTFDVIGYGSTVTFGGGAHAYPPTGERQAALLGLASVTPGWVHEDQNWSAGWGGACGGDSGGPNYLRGTHVIASTTITGDMVCRATNVALRLDTPSARAFLATQVGYPLP
ncbi:MAG TPA: trypsin-like serine protease [Humibacillus xanthopallidus]|nr:trypsin-like serine protease [Humibacillus xanthopallidus]